MHFALKWHVILSISIKRDNEAQLGLVSIILYAYKNFDYVDRNVMKPCYLYAKNSQNILLRWPVYIKTTQGIFFLNIYLPYL